MIVIPKKEDLRFGNRLICSVYWFDGIRINTFHGSGIHSALGRVLFEANRIPKHPRDTLAFYAEHNNAFTEGDRSRYRQHVHRFPIASETEFAVVDHRIHRGDSSESSESH